MYCEYIKTFVKQKMNNNIFLQILSDTFVKFLSAEFACSLVTFFVFCNLKYYIKLGGNNAGEGRKAIAYLLDGNFSILGCLYELLFLEIVWTPYSEIFSSSFNI